MAAISRKEKALIMNRAGVSVEGIAILLDVSRRQAFRYLEGIR